MQKIQTNTAEETRKFAKDYALSFRNGGILALSGDLGAGKTTFAQGFAKGLGVEDRIVSPTFLIIRQYPIPNQNNFFYHIDLYRMEDIDLKNSGLEEILSEPSNVVLIEWAEKIADHLPENINKLLLRKVGNSHEIELQTSE